MARTDDVLFTGNKGGLLVRLSEQEDFRILKKRLQEKLDSHLTFFHGSSVTIDVGNRVLTTKELLELERMFSQQHGLRVLQVVNGGQHEAARMNEELTEGSSVRIKAVRSNTPFEGEGTTTRLSQKEPFSRESGNAGQDPGPLQENAVFAVDPQVTMLVKRTLRSGQKVRYNGNVVVLGDVNPGAEVIASGDIVVVGALRGVAHAGATGNQDAIVAAFRLAPTQLRIAQHISRPPDGEAIEADMPEVARVRNGKIMIDTYVTG